MFPQLHCRYRHFAMEAGWDAHDNRFEAAHFQQVAIICIDGGRWYATTGFLTPIWIRLRERNEFRPRQPSQVREVNSLCKPAAADDTNFERLAHL